MCASSTENAAVTGHIVNSNKVLALVRAGTTDILPSVYSDTWTFVTAGLVCQGGVRGFLEDAVTTATAAAEEQDYPDDGTASTVTAWVAKAETVAIATAAAQ